MWTRRGRLCLEHEVLGSVALGCLLVVKGMDALEEKPLALLLNSCVALGTSQSSRA